MVASRRVVVAAVASLAFAAMLGWRGDGVRNDAAKASDADPPRAISVYKPPERSVFVMERGEAVRHAASSAQRMHADHPRMDFPIVPLDPQVGFVVDADTFDWLPRGLGLRAGDTVLGINDEPMVSTGQLVEAVRGASEGSAVELRVRRASTGEVLSYWSSP